MIRRPQWLDGLRVVAPADPAMLDGTFMPAGSWIVRHGVHDRALNELSTNGHRMVSIDDQHTIVAPVLYIAR
jgi:hypothetical protein